MKIIWLCNCHSLTYRYLSVIRWLYLFLISLPQCGHFIVGNWKRPKSLKQNGHLHHFICKRNHDPRSNKLIDEDISSGKIRPKSIAIRSQRTYPAIRILWIRYKFICHTSIIYNTSVKLILLWDLIENSIRVNHSSGLECPEEVFQWSFDGISDFFLIPKFHPMRKTI